MTTAKEHLKNIRRFDPDQKSRKGFLRLDMNENASGVPEDFLKRVLAKLTPEDLSRYPEYRPLNDAIARHAGISRENICLTNGSDAAIKYIFDAFVCLGDKVLLTDPTFAMYPVYARIYQAGPIMAPYSGDFVFPFDAFCEGLSQGPKLAVIVNPNNPTGSVLEVEKIRDLISRARERGVLLIVDEAYFYYCPRTVIEHVNEFDNLIVLRTFSKLCGLAAARLGYAAAHPRVIEALRAVKPTFDVNGLAVAFAEELLSAPGVFDDLVRDFQEGKTYLENKLKESGVGYRAGHANFVLIDCKGSAPETMRRLAQRGILVNGGFEQPFLKNYIRVTVGNEEVMRRFWEVFSPLITGALPASRVCEDDARPCARGGN